jgi:hypothetical protein
MKKKNLQAGLVAGGVLYLARLIDNGSGFRGIGGLE